MKVKVSGYQLAKLKKQYDDLNSEIHADAGSISAKEKELEILKGAIESLQKLGGEKAE